MHSVYAVPDPDLEIRMGGGGGGAGNRDAYLNRGTQVGNQKK